MLNCDETQEIRIIIKEMRELFDTAWELNNSGNNTELSRMVTTCIPNIEESYLFFAEKAGKNDDKTKGDANLADEIAINALEKQEPKKPIFDNMKRIQCPICKHRQPIQHYKYCPFCSQRIDWNGFIEEVIGNEK